ncbi:MAG: isoleucine--tRNA ligase, partial [Deltaproteobacteria bacterium]|nr:isoleucine--tRNA ligase [Deltaproteobacteria bacterium]
APILSFSADEIWQYINGRGRTASVHAEATKALEVARKEKEIGHPLDASVTIGIPPELMVELAPYRDQFSTILIVSSAELVQADQLDDGIESETIPGVKIKVSPSNDQKCERCWIHDPTVGQDNNHPTICKRCLDVLEEITH